MSALRFVLAIAGAIAAAVPAQSGAEVVNAKGVSWLSRC